MRKVIAAALLIVTPMLFALPAFAEGKKDICIKRVKEAISLLKSEGENAIFKLNDMDQSQWKDEHYVFVLDEDGVLQVHLKPSLIGRKLVGVRDIKGKFFVKEFLKVGKNGSGWVSYYWKNPVTGKISLKHSYCEGVRVNGKIFTVCSGYQEG